MDLQRMGVGPIRGENALVEQLPSDYVLMLDSNSGAP